MELSDILAEGSAFYCSGIESKQQLLEFLAERAGAIVHQDTAAVLAAFAAREALGSTGLGEGIAVPHGKLAGLDRVVGVLVRLAEPVEFDALDDQPVDIVVALLAPVGAGAQHLKALSRVARALRTDAVVDALRATDEPTRLHAILTEPQATNQAA
jgi:PTS system nitrogen regulatory IIA component